MNFYSDDRFSKALQAAYFSKEDIVEPSLFKAGQKLWKIPVVNQRKPIFDYPLPYAFVDFFEPCQDALGETSKSVRNIDYIPKACHGIVELEQWFDQTLEALYQAAPTILWENFACWDDFVKHARQNRSNLFSDSRRRRRKLERELGTLDFVFNDTRPELIDTCLIWKSEQYRATGELDGFAHSENVNLFKALAEQGILLVSSLNASDKPVAIHLGILFEGRWFYWIPAYDKDYASFAPGRLLLLDMLEAGFREQHTEFDFMEGGEPYKWNYATHTRLIGHAGSLPADIRAKKMLRSALKPAFNWAFESSPNLKSKVKAAAAFLKV